jgi:hypothetical protein
MISDRNIKKAPAIASETMIFQYDTPKKEYMYQGSYLYLMEWRRG